MILLIDNYDSFTYNLYQYLTELGADVLVRRNDAITVAEAAALAPDGIVISPGPCTPREAGVSVPLIRELAGVVPILGVCLGHQAIAEAFGGRDNGTVPIGQLIAAGVVDPGADDGIVNGLEGLLGQTNDPLPCLIGG